MTIIKRVAECEILPRFYGVAWIDYNRRLFVTAPVPLNWIMRFGHAVWWRLIDPPRSRVDALESRMKAIEKRLGL